MSYQRLTTERVSFSNKQRIGQYITGWGVGLLPLWIGFLKILFPCNSLLTFLLALSYFYLLGDILTTFGLLWFPRVRFLGLGFLTSVILLILLSPLLVWLWWNDCGHFTF